MKQMGLLQTMSLLKFIHIPSGEDDTSFHRNNAILEKQTKSYSYANLITMVSPFQRNNILPGIKDLHSILLDYPFLKHFDKVIILPTWISLMLSSLCCDIDHYISLVNS